MAHHRGGGRVGRTALSAIGLAAALVLLGFAALPPPPRLALAALQPASSTLVDASPYYGPPLGSLAAQAAGSPGADELASAEKELSVDERRALTSKLQAARSRQAAIMDAEAQRAARMRQWRQRQQARRERVEEAEARKQAEVAAMRHAGKLGSWLASGDRSVPDLSLAPHSRGRREGSRRGDDAVRDGRGLGQQVEGVADLPSNWYMGGVALTGEEWRRRLGESVVEANIRTQEKVRKFQILVSPPSSTGGPNPSSFVRSSLHPSLLLHLAHLC
jgi:hypothetical protein